MKHWIKTPRISSPQLCGLLFVSALAGCLLTLKFIHPATSRIPADVRILGRAPRSAHAREVTLEALCNQPFQTICGNRGITRDPTGSVRPDVEGEVSTLRIYEEIIHQHPEWSLEQIETELVDTIFTPRRRIRLQEAFRWVRNEIIQFIEHQPESQFDEREKKILKKRVRSIQLQIPPPISLYADEPDLFTKNDVIYERTTQGTLRLRVGGAYVVNAKSWFNLVFTFAHELAHSIDPCEVRSSHLAFPAYDRLAACFFTKGIAPPRSGRKECEESDQLSEVFADWLAVQISARALEDFGKEFSGNALASAALNSVRDLCEQEDESSDRSKYDIHPTPQVRIETIFADHPGIQALLGCDKRAATNPTSSKYCDFDYHR